MHSALSMACKIGGAALAGAFACLPAFADAPEGSEVKAHQGVADKSWHIRMKEGATGAQVYYFDFLLTGGIECSDPIKLKNCVDWAGEKSVFEVALEGVTETDATELKKGVLSAISGACRSADVASVPLDKVEEIAPNYWSVDLQCPEFSGRGGN
ncbi:MAG: hypothetical protein AB7U46_08735 [Paenirhodobacter sp.]|uniref:hypothetical protein n=1 Tax=Paenirhodobacter sp. TaxID=1965326 RepID=UPI003D13C72B